MPFVTTRDCMIASPNIPIVYATITKMATIANAIYKCFPCCSHVYKIIGHIFNGYNFNLKT